MPGPVLLDLQAVQNREYAERGIARHTLEFARALLAQRPDLVGGLLLNPSLPEPTGLGDLTATGKLGTWEVLEAVGALEGARIHHVIAPFELEQPLDTLWPPGAAARGLRLVVTLHDLIPRVFPEHYHADPGMRRRYLAREELVRAADRVLSVSETTRREALDRMGLAPERVRVIGAGASAAFRRPASRDEALARAQASVAALEPGFVLYVGGIDHRKNIAGLLDAYARLPAGLREQHQLVVACRLGDGQRRLLADQAGRLGIAGRLVLTGFVPEDALVALYQATALFVFPSLYEGYGLPVAEATACGAPVVAADTSATAELVDPAGRFDPTDPVSIAGAVERALTDPATAAALAAAAERPGQTWSSAAGRAVAVYEELLAAAPAPRRRTMRVAFVTPLPPQASGVAVYSERLLTALAELDPAVQIDVFLDALEGGAGALAITPRPPAGVAGLHPVEHFGRVEAARGGYDAVVYAIGNSEYHTGALGLALRRPGIVLAHDVSLGQLYAFGAHHGVLPAPFGVLFRAMYPAAGSQPEDPLLVDPARFASLAWPMARDLIGASRVYLTTSRHAAALAAGDARPVDRPRIDVLVHAARVVPERPRPGGEVVVSFGVVNASKDTGRLLEGFAQVAAARPRARLVLVGQAAQQEREEVAAQARRLGIEAAVTTTGAVDAAGWDHWLRQATVAVQLRRRSNGEFSGAVAEALAFGVPTIVAALGAMAELPAEAAVRVPIDAPPGALAEAIAGLLADPGRQAALAAGGRAWAAERSFPVVAGELLGWIRRLAGQGRAGAAA